MGTTESKLKLSLALLGGGLFLYIVQDNSSSNSVSGISNLGNTCFLNAILQALSSCTTLTQFLFKLNPVEISPTDYDALIVIELSKFLQSLIQGKQTDPGDLIYALSNKFPYFGQQHDSHEIFYVIHESIESIKKRTENSISLDNDLENPLLGLMSTEIICSICKNKSIKLDCIFDISVNVSDSLSESFYNLRRKQVLEDFLCVKCSSDASIQFVKKFKATLLKEMLKTYSKPVLEEKDLLKKVKTRALIGNEIVKFPQLLIVHCK